MSSRRLLMLTILICSLPFVRQTAAQSLVQQPPANTFQLRPELAGVHPRLHFTAADTASIRQRATGPSRWYYDKAKADFGHYLSQRTPDNPGTWKDYLFGFWGQFAMCMFYIVEKDTAYANCARSWALFYAGRHDWLKDDLIPMDITSGMALTYDILYDYLSPVDRSVLRGALKRSLDTMMAHVFEGSYYTQDFQNNHMHNRIHGIAHAAVAMLGDDPAVDVQPHADLAQWCFEQIAAWAPDDGSTHEGPGYWDYGHHWLARGAELFRHTTGADPGGDAPHFTHSHLFRLYMTAPGWGSTFGIGDAGEGPPSNAEAWIPSLVRSGDAAADSVLRRLRVERRGGFYQHAMWGVLWSDPSLAPADYSSLPLYRFWPDLDMFSIRSSWSDTATAFVFKCGPPGGHKMQRLRANSWVNVAHDHPDQNHFLLASGGRMLAQDDGYPRQYKLTRSHNTIVIDSMGQMREGGAWYQPFDYSLCGRLDEVLLSGSIALAAGNASRLYANASRYIRHVAFVQGDYVVLIDDLAGSGGSHQFDWRLHKNGAWRAGADGEFFVDDSAGMSLQIRFLEPAPGALSSAFLPAEFTAQPCLSVKTYGAATRFTSILVPRRSAQPSLAASLLSATGGVAIEVLGPAHTDLFAVRIDSAAIRTATLFSNATHTLLRHNGSQLVTAAITRGSVLSYSDIPLLSSSVPINIALRPIAGGMQAEVGPPHGDSSVSVDLLLGGFVCGVEYALSIDGRASGVQAADTAGMLHINLSMSGPVVLKALDASSVRSSPPFASVSPVIITVRHELVRIRAEGASPLAQILVYDLAGRRVWQWHNSSAARRLMHAHWDVSSVTSGSYVATVRQQGQMPQRAVIVIR